MYYHLGIALISVLIAGSFRATAQGLPGSTLNEAQGQSGSGEQLEELYDKDETKPATKSDAQSERKNFIDKKPIPEAQSLSDLAKLAPFSDIAVIQRRFLPKTNRFEASATIFTNLNNPFFNSYGAGLGIAYYLREQYAIEGLANFSTSSAREVTNDLASSRNITTQSLVTSNGFYGAALKWNPIYGKMTWMNKGIVPFDLNFSAGGGITSTTDGQDVPTLHLGSSQVFALTKAMAVRWEFTWNMYQANAINQNLQKTKVTQNDLFLGIGMSFYFPEASYR